MIYKAPQAPNRGRWYKVSPAPENGLLKEIQAFFQRASDFLIGRVGRENIVSAVVHMDEKTPHLHLTFVPLTKDNRLCAKEIIGNRANLTKWQDDFHAYMVEKYPDLERGKSASKTGRKHIPTRLFKQAVSFSKQARAIEVCHRTAYRRLCSHRVQETPGNQKQADNRRGNPLDSREDF